MASYQTRTPAGATSRFANGDVAIGDRAPFAPALAGAPAVLRVKAGHDTVAVAAIA